MTSVRLYMASDRVPSQPPDAQEHISEAASPASPVLLAGMPVHPACDLFQLMDDISLSNLESDIRRNGLLNAIVVHNGELVDGRNRVIACQRAQVEPRLVEWRDAYHGDLSIARWIWSINAERRHLTNDQYVAIAVELCAYEEREAAKIRQVAAGKEHGRGRGKVQTNSSEAVNKRKPAPQVRTQIAQQFGISEYKTQQALNVQQAQPELFRQVRQGKVSLREAAKRVKPISPELVKAADHDYNRASNIRAMVEAIETLTEGIYTLKELARWHVDEPFHNNLDTLLYALEHFAAGFRKEIWKERERRKPHVVNTI
jgi:hypothetical protein